ncbi:MAG: lysophospholipid acyltransferase family protein [Thermoanaerobaculales bacterium]|nr:lysophospholipid acyltransferase family protein [Thermoanaerobaculales bacterium]
MFKLIVGILSRTPFPVAWCFSWTIAWLWWVVAPVRKAVAVDGFSRAFPELPAGPNLRRATAGFVMGYLELFRETRQPCIDLTIEGADVIQEHVDRGQGMILVAGHFGSWDLLGPMVCRQEALPATVVVKTTKWKPAADFIDEIRRKFGMGLLPPKNSFSEIMEELASGRVIVFLLDQRYRKGIPVPFFGRPAWTSPAVAVAVQRSGVPVFGLDYWREGVGKHRARFTGPLEMIGDVERDTMTIQSFYESCIRERPHGWLWLHDRWTIPRHLQTGNQ